MMKNFTSSGVWNEGLLVSSFFCLFFLAIVPEALAQDARVITGTVTSEEGTLPGVSILLKGSAGVGTTTDMDGNYRLELPADVQEGTLIFSYIGYANREVSISNQSQINVTLREDIDQLEEVVVVGYGTQRKRDVTGSITSIKSEEIEDRPVANPLNAIQGKASGITITNSGQAGAAPTLRIRGVGSTSNTNPLYVVDGIFTDNIDFVNPNDIASMEILKDASSLAMFGVQGANGVVIITTKRAKEGRTTVNVSSYAGIQRVNERVGLANAEQFKMLYNEQLLNLGEPAFDFSQYNADTDWQEAMLRDAFINNNSISVRSATERNQANLSMSYFKQEGVVKYDAYSRFTAHLRDEYKVNDNLTVGADLSAYRWERDPATGNLTAALWAAPVYAPRDEDGNWNPSPTFQRAQISNPVAMMEIFRNKTISEGYRFLGSGFVEVDFLKALTWRSAVYGDLGFNNNRSYTPLYEIGTGENRAQFNEVTEVSQQKENFTSWQMDHTLTYQNTFNDKHELTTLVGITSRIKGSDFISGGRRSQSPVNIPDDPNLWYLGIGQDDPSRTNNGGALEEAFLSYLFRTNYSYEGKYLLNVSFRRDGTSKFSPNRRWGNFPAIGVGWVLSEENFMQGVDLFQQLKIKGSWGRLGNDKVGDYLFYPVLNNSQSAVFGDRVFPAVQPAYIPNPNLGWEVVEGTDVGLEFMMLQGRLNVESAYYNRKTHDILVLLTIPGAVGTNQFLTNAGSILNRGVEFSLDWSDDLNDDWGYSINGNLTTIHNEVLSIGDNADYNIQEGSSRTAVGHPIGSFYGLVMEGIFQSEEEVANSPQAGTALPGDIRFRDVNGDGVLDFNEDRTFIGSPTPDLTYGFSVGLNFRNFSLDVETQGVSGNVIYRERSRATFAIINYEENRLARWTGPGTSNEEPILDNTRTNNFQHSSYFLDPGDYFRIRNVALGYNFNAGFLRRLRMSSGRVYINAQNPITFTKATGFTPEVGGSPIRFGVDNGVYPIPATYTIGFNLNF